MIALELDEVVRVVGGRADAALCGSARRVCTDSREVKPGDLFFALRGERFDGHDFVPEVLKRGACAAIVSRPCDTGGPAGAPLIRVADTVEALGKLAAFHRTLLSATVIAITGSNGKTTTKCMIDHVLSRRLRGRASIKSFNNAIGVPLTLLAANAKDEYLICEIGTNAPGEVAALATLVSPSVAIVTSIGEEHLEGFGTIENIAVEEFSVLGSVRARGLAIANLDHPLARPMLANFKQLSVVTFGTCREADVRVSDIRPRLFETRFRINERYEASLPMCGAHNAVNAAAAFAVGRRLKIEPEVIVAALGTFEPPAMRSNVERLGDITLIDDCYNANPASMAAAVDVLKNVATGRRVMFAGDMLELGAAARDRHVQLGASIAKAGIEVLVAVGAMASNVAEGARRTGSPIEVTEFPDSERASEQAGSIVGNGDTVLVKGSRGIRMERIVAALRTLPGRRGAERAEDSNRHSSAPATNLSVGRA